MQIFQEVLTLIGICWLKVLFNLSLSDSNDVAMQNSIYSMAAGLMFAKLHLNETSRTMSFGQTRSKWRCKALMHSTIFGENKTPHTSCGVWRWGGGVMIWACFKATGLGNLPVIQLTTNSLEYQSILEAICLSIETRMKLDHATGENQNKISEKEKT